MQTYLGIDFGFKRIGLATGQSLTGSTSALNTIANSKQQTNWDAIDKAVQEWQPNAFVLGLPLNKDGTDHEVSKAVRVFAAELEQRYSKPVYFQDERLSSSEAEGILQQQRASGTRKKKVQKEDIDKLAAALILQRWLDANC